MASQPVQPSPPVTPIEEEDISRAGVYSEQPKTTRSKGKQRAEDPFDEDDTRVSSEGSNAEERYPPVNDEEAESRRVAENLRRWEMAERQRRKAARESTASSVGGGSIVGDVARRASFLWQTRRSKQPAPQGPGTHHKLHNSEDEVALDDIDNQLSAPPSPMPPEDPFKTPAASTVSLNDPQHSAIMSEAATVTLKSPKADEELLAAPPARPGKLDRKKSLREHPPPQPLDLPEPRSPPPPAGTPAADRPPEPIPPPSTTARQDPEPEEEHVPEKRWWTDWLCGCREDGDKQAGRTNPFE